MFAQTAAHLRSPGLFARLLVSWLTNALVLAVVTGLLTTCARPAGALLAAAAVFGVLNTMLKPLLQAPDAPARDRHFRGRVVLRLDAMLVITETIVGGFDIHGFWTLVGATLIVWAVNLVLDFTPGPWQVTGRRRRRYRQA